jgi:hypothetical protein
VLGNAAAAAGGDDDTEHGKMLDAIAAAGGDPVNALGPDDFHAPMQQVMEEPAADGAGEAAPAPQQVGA